MVKTLPTSVAADTLPSMPAKKKTTGEKGKPGPGADREIRSVAYTRELFDAVNRLADADGRTFAAESAFLMHIGAAIYGGLPLPSTVRVEDLIARLQGMQAK